jgi:hypothetical protein
VLASLATFVIIDNHAVTLLHSLCAEVVMALLFGFFSVGPKYLLIVAVPVVVIVAVVVLIVALRGKKKVVDPDAGLDEDLSEYPPAPRPGTHRLSCAGQKVRIRLVVLAPSGRNIQLDTSMAEGVMETILHGLGSVADLDKPRIRIWPPQLSQKGFAPTFFRHVLRPEGDDKNSPWILVAGPARVGAKPVLLGLALQAGEPSGQGNISLDMEKWADRLRVDVVE